MRRRASVFAFFLLAAIGAAIPYGQAANLNVNCDRKETIREVVKLLAAANPQGPNTITVAGSCRENILIQGMERLTLITKKGASIADHSNGRFAVVDIEGSRSVTLQGFTINGGATGVSCGTASTCHLTGNTIQGAGTGIRVFVDSHAFLESNVIQDNGGRGCMVTDDSHVFSSNDVFQGNGAQGAVVLSSFFESSNSSFLNNAAGIEAGVASLSIRGGTISGNSGDGILLLGAASSIFMGPTITANGGVGVHLEDGAFGGFIAANITGNLSGLDVECAPQFPVTRFVERTGGITNCEEGASNSKRKNTE